MKTPHKSKPHPKLPALTKPTRKLAATPNGKMRRGFNAISKERQREIAGQGGRAVVKRRGRAWMAKLGAKGGTNSHKGTSLRNKARKEA